MSLHDKTHGGTAHILPAERAKASFSVEKMKEYWIGGAAKVAERKMFTDVFDKIGIYDNKDDYFMDRQDLFRKTLKRTMMSFGVLRSNPKLMKAHMPQRQKGGGHAQGFVMGNATHQENHSAGDHFGLFISTMGTQATPRQMAQWIVPAMSMKIIGTYAQTELGHGSNVRGIETTATYDQEADEFIVDSPYITSLKWWPGALGVLATHAIIYARLILKGKDLGFHAFIIQIRDENHDPLPGVIVGDIGPKMGYAKNDSGYLGFTDVRIPRTNMLMKFYKLDKNGNYTAPPPKLKRISYITMTRTRASIVRWQSEALSKAVTIAIRYNAVRHQGFNDTKAENPMSTGERSILDYTYQQYRLFSELAMVYAIHFGYKDMMEVALEFEGKLATASREGTEVDTSGMPELHATSAGMKSWCTKYSVAGIESVRLCCGGQGYSLSSGIAQILNDFLPGVTYEGDHVILSLQTARYLLKQMTLADSGEAVPRRVGYLAEAPSRGCPAYGIGELSTLCKIMGDRAHTSVRHAQTVFKGFQSQGMSYDDAWNASHLELMKAAEHHINFILMAGYQRQLVHVEDPAINKVYTRLASLFGLTRIRHGGAGDWPEGYFTTYNTITINKEINQILADLRPDAVSIVDSFGWPDRALNSCIGKYDGNVYEALFDWAERSPFNKPEFQKEIFNKFLKKRTDKKLLARGNKLKSKL